MFRAFKQVRCFLLAPHLERVQNGPGPGQGHLREGQRRPLLCLADRRTCSGGERRVCQAGRGMGVRWVPAVGLSCHKLPVEGLSLILFAWPLPAQGAGEERSEACGSESQLSGCHLYNRGLSLSLRFAICEGDRTRHLS